MFKSLEELKSYCEKNDIKMIDFKMIDLAGRYRHLTIPVKRFTEKTLRYGIGFDGSNYGFAPVEKSDMVFIPDISTASIEAFAHVPTLSMIGDVLVIDDPPRRFDQDPRAVAKKAEQYLKATGIADELRIGPEFEFYVFDSMRYEIKPNSCSFKLDSEQAEWNSDEQGSQGYTARHKGAYHIAQPTDRNFDLRSEMCLLLEERGVEVKYHHTEVGGPGQLEIEVEFGGVCEMADKTMLIKYIVRNAAFSAGKSATFMPKPLFDEAGSGMHVHMHLFKDGKPLFYDEKGYSGLSKTALNFIGGLLTHARSLCAITDPSTNSYKRLVPGYEAPVSICFATANRSAVIRIPDYARAPEDKRFEIRSPDATCNPYLAYAAILMAGIDGMKKEIDPVACGFGPYDVNLYDLPEEERAKIRALPYCLQDALDALEEDHDYLLEGGVFTKELLGIWIKSKRRDAEKMGRIPHPAEFEQLYDL